MNESIGIIGFGNMGSVIAEWLKKKYRVCVFDKDKGKTKTLSGITISVDIPDLVRKSQVVIIAVKPQDIDAVLREVKNTTKDKPQGNGLASSSQSHKPRGSGLTSDSQSHKLVISIAAGIPTTYIEKALGKASVVRAMPNICARIGESVTCLAKGKFVTDEDLELAQEIFYYLGVTRLVEEKMMNAVTAISGSGPAYIFNFIETNSIDPNNIPQYTHDDIIEHLENAAEAVGFNPDDARFMATNTVNAAINLVKKTKVSPAELIKQVASKGGTTEAALKVLEKGGSWEEAGQAALKRAQDLSKRE